jgi:N-acetyl-1-D-myo-inositol-2-amino-2-deoxy-alpha-D-glucopyranoside deacetylase
MTGTELMTPGRSHADIGGIVAVHAHPDDESITMGATLARYAAAGIPVTLVTATLGEQGETMYGRWDGLDAAHADQLGGYRFAELENACAAMGVVDRRMLGGLGVFRDSGMAGEPSARHPRAFIRAQTGGDLHDAAVGALAEILDERRPLVVISYDATGGYRHPDHIAAHQVASAAFARYRAARADEHDAAPAARLLEVVRPRSAVAQALAELWRTPPPGPYTRPDVHELGTLVADGDVDIVVDARPWAERRRAAMAAHRTQLDVWSGPIDGFALTNLKAQPLLAAEYFRVLAGAPTPTGATDIMAGLRAGGNAVR